MIHFRLGAMVVLFLASIAAAAAPAEKLTVVIDFQNDYSEQSVAGMKREVERLFQNSNLRIAWASRDEATRGNPGELAVIRFQGACLPQPWIAPARETAALAHTHVADGVVLPFSDVACDRIAAMVVTEVRGIGAERAEALFGLAMGRVVAHELVHILSRSESHGKSGVTEPGLSAAQLTAGALGLGWQSPIQSAYAP